MAIEQVKVRAKVTMGNLSVETPYVQSFNVTKTRGQISTFSASLKIDADEVSGSITGSNILIEAGTEGGIKAIFTGIVKQAKISPCWDDPHYVILSMSGEDVLSTLVGKKYSRRCRATRSMFITITGVTREGLKSGKFGHVNEPHFYMGPGDQESEKPQTKTSPSRETNVGKISPQGEASAVNLVLKILTFGNPAGLLTP